MAAREGVACYRLYDADVPEYACAIDLYEGAAEAEGELYAHVAEYAPPKSVDPDQARARFEDVLSPGCRRVLGHSAGARCFPSPACAAKGGGQYRDAGGRRFVTHTSEDGLICEMDLGGYLDTGIFLDHRVTREMVGKMGRRQTLPEPVRLYGRGDAACCGRRCEGDDDGGLVSDVPGLGGPQSCGQRVRLRSC